MGKDWNGNKNSIFKTLGASNHTDKERENDDFYATDPAAIDKLLTVEKPYHKIWECACGEGHLSERLKQNGYNVFSSDLIDRGYGISEVDFLSCTSNNLSEDILTNPPYKYAKEFVLKALECIKEGRKAYFFLKVQFLEGKTRKKELFDLYPPKTVYIFSERVLCAKNADFQGMKKGGGSAVAYAWFVWEKGYKGDTVIKWL